ncbi:hypothetical protein V491_05206 [Pseudogymnoascus sp. VKM F-3775]|nr:hypothetical protein V491_05206 [Pseudogymnoascus sp. VKM F-3775]
MASTTTTTTTLGTTEDIDALLTTYLSLLHTYTTLRAKLTALQSSVRPHLSPSSSLFLPHSTYQPTTHGKGEKHRLTNNKTSLSLTRTSLSTPIPLGYTSGTTKLDATARLRVTPPHDDDGDDESEGKEERGGSEIFTLLPVPVPVSTRKTKAEGGDGGGESDADDEKEGGDDAEGEDGDKEADSDDAAATKSNKKQPPPPLPPGFGVLASPSLREAQGTAIEAVAVISQLAGIDIQMRGIEVEVRRARKRALKAGKTG